MIILSCSECGSDNVKTDEKVIYETGSDAFECIDCGWKFDICFTTYKEMDRCTNIKET